jgi:fanconi anemia group J protein
MQLGTQFGVVWSAPHVVDLQRQVWAGVLSRGPAGPPVEATYKHTDTLVFQDSVGAAVLEVCRTVPDGVLFFLPSYALLEKLKLRWEVSRTLTLP